MARLGTATLDCSGGPRPIDFRFTFNHGSFLEFRCPPGQFMDGYPQGGGQDGFLSPSPIWVAPSGS